MTYNHLTLISDTELEERIKSCAERRATCVSLSANYLDMANCGQEFADKAEKYKVMGYDENTLLMELRAEQARRRSL